MAGLDLAVLLAASGLVSVTIMDFDLVEGRNLDQLMGPTCRDVNLRGGVHVANREAHRNATAPELVVRTSSPSRRRPMPGPSPAFIRRSNRHGVSATVPWRIKICAGLAAVVESRALRRRPEGSAATPSTCREARSLRVLSIRPPVQPRAHSATLGPGAQRQATGHLHHVPPYRSEFGRSVRTQRGCAVDGCRVVRCEDHIGHRGRGD